MGEVSGIAWTDATFNPWWGCTRVSPGCENCYAETLATVRRKLDVWGVDAARQSMSEAYWREPLKWNKRAAAEGVQRRVFCGSMCDFAELVPERNAKARDVQMAALCRLWPLVEATPSLIWLLLTKRPQNVAAVVPRAWMLGGFPPNVWLGTTTEDQKRYDERWPVLSKIPARVHFISHEPALEPIVLRGEILPDWVITGGESGPGARFYDHAWAESIIEQCRLAGLVPFVKQLGANTSLPLNDRKGGDPAEWPAHLRVQEFPGGAS